MDRARQAARNPVVLHNPATDESFVVLRSASDSNSEVFMLEFTMPAGRRQRTHSHPKQETIVQVHEGTLHGWLGAEERVLLAGETFTIPPGVAHRLENRADAPARGVEQYRPAYRAQAYFETLVALGRSGGQGPDLLQRAVLWRAYPETVGIPLLLAPLFFLLALLGRLAGRRHYLNPYPDAE